MDSMGLNSTDIATQVIRHHIRLLGIRRDEILVIDKPDASKIAQVKSACAAASPVVISNPDLAFCEAFSVDSDSGSSPQRVLSLSFDSNNRWSRLRTLHDYSCFNHIEGIPLVKDENNSSVWLWTPEGQSGIIWLGTQLADDLTRYRQGDPARAQNRHDEAMWGFSGERPLYLFEEQLGDEAPDERHADWWAMALVRSLEKFGGIAKDPILPRNAPGAVVLTGDDDQAMLENYARQLNIIGDTPITYFMHPKTQHTTETMSRDVYGKKS